MRLAAQPLGIAFTDLAGFLGHGLELHHRHCFSSRLFSLCRRCLRAGWLAVRSGLGVRYLDWARTCTAESTATANYALRRQERCRTNEMQHYATLKYCLPSLFMPRCYLLLLLLLVLDRYPLVLLKVISLLSCNCDWYLILDRRTDKKSSPPRW